MRCLRMVDRRRVTERARTRQTGSKTGQSERGTSMAAHGRMESVAAYQGCSQSARCSVSHPIRSNPRLVGPGNPLPRDRRRSSLFPTRNESPYLCFFVGLISTAPFVRSNRGLNHETRDVGPLTFFSFFFHWITLITRFDGF